MTIDYDLQPGYVWNGQGSWPYYQIESQLITYSPPNFALDVAMEEILSPNDNKLFNRYNPVCGEPVVAIRNNGTTLLTSAEILYGPVGGHQQRYTWHGNLAFNDTVHITLPAIDWSDWTPNGANRFYANVENPNGQNDYHTINNLLETSFTIPPTYDNLLKFAFKTNHEAGSLSWELEDGNGNILYQNGLLEQNTVYTDTFHLSRGCYRLNIRNAAGEGLQYWANMPPYGNGTAGYARIDNMAGQTVKSFQGDFGSVISQAFTVGMTIDVPELHPGGFVTIFPNPSSGLFWAGVVFDRKEEVTIEVTNAMGKEVLRSRFPSVQKGSLPVDLTGREPGLYLVTVTSGEGTVVKKVLVY